MWDWLFNSLWGWLGVTGVVVAACVAVAIFFPTLRAWCFGIAGSVLSATAIYAKGQRDRAAVEQRRKDEAIAGVQAKYDEIDRAPRTTEAGEKALKDGTF